MDSSPSLRADARRTRQRIIATAITTFGSEPLASLERIAAVAGVHRATLYRHFSCREQLVEAAVARALEEGRAVVDRIASLPVDESAVHALAAETTQFGDRYSFLIGLPELSTEGPENIGLPALMKDWQSHQLLRADVTPEWLAAAFTALAQALFTPGAVPSHEQRHQILTEMFLRGAASR